MKRVSLPSLASEATLTECFDLELVSRGPTSNGWEGDYLRCPVCSTFVLKSAESHGCPCGNIFIDADALRVVVEKGPESAIEVFKATWK